MVNCLKCNQPNPDFQLTCYNCGSSLPFPFTGIVGVSQNSENVVFSQTYTALDAIQQFSQSDFTPIKNLFEGYLFESIEELNRDKLHRFNYSILILTNSLLDFLAVLYDDSNLGSANQKIEKFLRENIPISRQQINKTKVIQQDTYLQNPPYSTKSTWDVADIYYHAYRNSIMHNFILGSKNFDISNNQSSTFTIIQDHCILDPYLLFNELKTIFYSMIENKPENSAYHQRYMNMYLQRT